MTKDGQPSSHPYFLEVNPETLQLADARTGQACWDGEVVEFGLVMLMVSRWL